MPIDVERLMNDAEALHKARPVQPPTGVYAAIVAATPTIDALRLKDVHWAVIAAALAAQGITQLSSGGAVPITGNRLSSLVSDIKKKEKKRLEKAEQRAQRRDLSAAAPGKSTRSTKLSLAAELTVKAPDVTPSGEGDTEETIRRQQFDAVQSFIKPTR